MPEADYRLMTDATGQRIATALEGVEDNMTEKLPKDFSTLPALPSAPTTGDELAIERGTGAYKIDYNALASAIIAQTQRDIAIVVEGNKTTHTGGAAVGAYVIVHNSTISGIADGLYKAVQAIPANTTITSAYLAAVDGGGLNDLGKRLNSTGGISSQIDIAGQNCQSGAFLTIAEFHPTVEGNYIIVADATYDGNADGIRILLVDVVETNQNTAANSVLASGRAALQKTRMFNLSTNDTVYIRIYQSSGVTLTVAGSYRFALLKT